MLKIFQRLKRCENWEHKRIFSVLLLFINRHLNYSCRANWYYTSERCKKLLLLIMNRTVLPCKITAGKVATLSIESFGVVSKTLLSVNLPSSYILILRYTL